MKKIAFKQYIPTFCIALIFCGLLMIVRHSQGGYFFTTNMAPSGEAFNIFLYKGKEFFPNQYILDWVFLLVFALGFVILFFLIDLATGKVKTEKKLREEAETKRFDTFVDQIGSELNKIKAFNVEDFRHFRENPKLQDCLKKLYKIYNYGETADTNYFLVLRKFEKGSTEREAIEYLVTFTEKQREKDKEAIEAYLKEKALIEEKEALEAQKKQEKKNKKKQGK